MTTLPQHRRYAFWPEGKSATWPAIKGRVYPWNFYWLTDAQLSGCPCPYELAIPDESRVGSSLKKMFAMFGFGSKAGCNCAWIKEMLDEAPIEFIASHKTAVVKLVVNSAAQQRVTAPAAIVERFVAIALWRERRRIRGLHANVHQSFNESDVRAEIGGEPS